MSDTKYLLEEFKIAVSKFVPMTPADVTQEAKEALARFEEASEPTEGEIKKAMIEIGKKEYPYRKAYHELCAGDEEKRLQAIVLDRLEKKVREKVEAMTSHGVILEEYVKSPLFEEQLDADERLQVEQAILLADDVLEHQCDDRAKNRKASFEELLAKWTKTRDQIELQIERLRQFGISHPSHTADILATVDRLEEGFSITNPDPTEEEVLREIEYWDTVFVENEEGLA